MDLPRYVLVDRATKATFREVPAVSSENLYETLARNGLPIRTSCRGSTICGRCWVVLEDEDLSELPPAAPDERMLLDRHAAGEPRARLACRLELPKGRKTLTVSTDYWRAPG